MFFKNFSHFVFIFLIFTVSPVVFSYVGDVILQMAGADRALCAEQFANSYRKEEFLGYIMGLIAQKQKSLNTGCLEHMEEFKTDMLTRLFSKTICHEFNKIALEDDTAYFNRITNNLVEAIMRNGPQEIIFEDVSYSYPHNSIVHDRVVAEFILRGFIATPVVWTRVVKNKEVIKGLVAKKLKEFFLPAKLKENKLQYLRPFLTALAPSVISFAIVSFLLYKLRPFNVATFNSNRSIFFVLGSMSIVATIYTMKELKNIILCVSKKTGSELYQDEMLKYCNNLLREPPLS